MKLEPMVYLVDSSVCWEIKSNHNYQPNLQTDEEQSFTAIKYDDSYNVILNLTVHRGDSNKIIGRVIHRYTKLFYIIHRLINYIYICLCEIKFTFVSEISLSYCVYYMDVNLLIIYSYYFFTVIII